MDKEKILSQNKKENLYLDEYEKHIKLQGKSFGLMFVLFICILILFIKAVCKEPYYDIMTIIGSVAFDTYLLARQAGESAEYIDSARIYCKLAESKVAEAYNYLMHSDVEDVDLFKKVGQEETIG